MELFGFQRRIQEYIVTVYIDSELYNNAPEFFDCLFSTFYNYRCLVSDSDALFILSTNNKACIKKTQHNTIYICNTNVNINWQLVLIGVLEDYYANILRCTIIHGSCVKLQNKNLLMIGRRKAGKTTLTAYLTIQKSALYLDDDCVYIINNRYVGFNMPILVRDNIDGLNRDNLIGECLDGEGINRKLFVSNISIKETQKIDVIVFPQFNSIGINQYIQIRSGELYNKVLLNIRHSNDPQSLFMDINNVIKTSRAFIIQYTNSENAFKLIESVL